MGSRRPSPRIISQRSLPSRTGHRHGETARAGRGPKPESAAAFGDSGKDSSQIRGSDQIHPADVALAFPSAPGSGARGRSPRRNDPLHVLRVPADAGGVPGGPHFPPQRHRHSLAGVPDGHRAVRVPLAGRRAWGGKTPRWRRSRNWRDRATPAAFARSKNWPSTTSTASAITPWRWRRPARRWFWKTHRPCAAARSVSRPESRCRARSD